MFISLLLKKALPFALTFVVGTALGGLTWLFGGSEKKAETVLVTRVHDYGSRCRMRSHKLVAESKSLRILSVPAAWWPRGVKADNDYAVVNVTFGADGRVGRVGPPEGSAITGVMNNTVHHRAVRVAALKAPPVWEAVKSAAQHIQFEPEKVNGVPVSVTKDVEIRFIRD